MMKSFYLPLLLLLSSLFVGCFTTSETALRARGLEEVSNYEIKAVKLSILWLVDSNKKSAKGMEVELSAFLADIQSRSDLTFTYEAEAMKNDRINFDVQEGEMNWKQLVESALHPNGFKLEELGEHMLLVSRMS